MKEQNSHERKLIDDILPVAVGEAVVALLVICGALLLNLIGIIATFDFKIILGALLGAAVIVVNHVFLSIKVDLEIKKFVKLRGDKEMTDEEADKFAKENSTNIQNAMKSSFVIRTASILITLLVAFITKLFNPIATAIPMFAFRAIITASELIRMKYNKKPDPSKFIKYDFDEKDTEKEED